MSVIADTTVVSNFAGIGQLHLLRLVFGSLHISTEVYGEIKAGLAAAYRFYEAVERVVDPPNPGGWLRLVALEGEEELRAFRECPPRLHAGEAASMAIAQHRGWTLLTDDRAARTEAVRRGIRVSGTIGVLVIAVQQRRCTLDEANAWLRAMVARGYHAPLADITPLLEP